MLNAAALAVSTLVASLLGSGASPSAALTFGSRAGTDIAPLVSANWSGYAAAAPDGTTAAFSDVTATWVQPKVTCTAGRSDAAAFWVGLGGNSETAPALEQLGTGAECNGSSTAPTYDAWWEIVPAAAVPIPLKVQPGDRVTAAVLVSDQTVTMSLKNITRKTRFSKTLTLTQPLDVSSAEWIAEAPSLCTPSGRCRPVPLSRFGTVTFTNAAAIGNTHPGTISDTAWTASPIELISDGGGGGRFFGAGDILGPAVGALPGSLSADGRSFSVAWQQSVTPPAQ
ncbi:MAG TPA: G1 family glutamic endopeptidase [Gaiellaceae bacterium]